MEIIPSAYSESDEIQMKSAFYQIMDVVMQELKDRFCKDSCDLYQSLTVLNLSNVTFMDWKSLLPLVNYLKLNETETEAD